LQSKICNKKFTIKNLKPKIYNKKFTIKKFTIKNLQSKIYNRKFTIENLQSKIYSQKFTIKKAFRFYPQPFNLTFSSKKFEGQKLWRCHHRTSFFPAQLWFCPSSSGWPDWAIFLLWPVVKAYISSPSFLATSTGLGKWCINSDKKRVGLQFGRFFRKLIWSPWSSFKCMNGGGWHGPGSGKKHETQNSGKKVSPRNWKFKKSPF
jgi:hypothetical protein